jgi:hypothetical protein
VGLELVRVLDPFANGLGCDLPLNFISAKCDHLDGFQHRDASHVPDHLRFEKDGVENAARSRRSQNRVRHSLHFELGASKACVVAPNVDSYFWRHDGSLLGEIVNVELPFSPRQLALLAKIDEAVLQAPFIRTLKLFGQS